MLAISPLYGNSAERRVFEFVSLFGAEVAVFVDAAGEEVLHQAGLDALLLGNQRLRLFNRPVHRRENLGDFGLFGFGGVGILTDSIVDIGNPYRVEPEARRAK